MNQTEKCGKKNKRKKIDKGTLLLDKILTSNTCPFYNIPSFSIQILEYLTIFDLKVLNSAFAINHILFNQWLLPRLQDYKINHTIGLSVYHIYDIIFLKKFGFRSTHLRIYTNNLNASHFKKLLQFNATNSVILDNLELIGYSFVSSRQRIKKLGQFTVSLLPYLSKLKSLSLENISFAELAGNLSYRSNGIFKQPSLLLAIQEQCRNLIKLDVTLDDAQSMNSIVNENIGSDLLTALIELNPHIEHVYLADACINTNFLLALSHLPNKLKHLGLFLCSINVVNNDTTNLINDTTDIADIIANIISPTVTESLLLTCSCFPQGQISVLKILRQCGPNLLDLQISSGHEYYINNECIYEIANRCPNLQTLDLVAVNSFRGISEDAKNVLFQKCSQLKKFVIS
jgi:hypothetical protein